MAELLTSGQVSLCCRSHHSLLAKRLWNRVLDVREVDINLMWGGQSVHAHRLVLDLFLSSDKLLETAGQQLSGDAVLLDALLEFAYLGRVTLPAEKLPNLLDVARQTNFDLLVDVLEKKIVSESEKAAEINLPVGAGTNTLVRSCFISLERLHEPPKLAQIDPDSFPDPAPTEFYNPDAVFADPPTTDLVAQPESIELEMPESRIVEVGQEQPRPCEPVLGIVVGSDMIQQPAWNWQEIGGIKCEVEVVSESVDFSDILLFDRYDNLIGVDMPSMPSTSDSCSSSSANCSAAPDPTTDWITTLQLDTYPPTGSDHSSVSSTNATVAASALPEDAGSSDSPPSHLAKCGVCEETFPHPLGLKDHLEEAHPRTTCNRTYKCGLCSSATWCCTYAVLHAEQHRQQHTEVPKRQYSCEACPKTFKFQKHLMWHQEFAHRTTTELPETKNKVFLYGCRFCRHLTFDRVNELERHLAEKHPNDVSEADTMTDRWQDANMLRTNIQGDQCIKKEQSHMTTDFPVPPFDGRTIKMEPIFDKREYQEL